MGRGHYVLLGVAAMVLASIAFDVGHHATTSDRASDLRGLVNQVKTDLASCNASIRDSFAACRTALAPKLTYWPKSKIVRTRTMQAVSLGPDHFARLAGDLVAHHQSVHRRVKQRRVHPEPVDATGSLG